MKLAFNIYFIAYNIYENSIRYYPIKEVSILILKLLNSPY